MPVWNANDGEAAGTQASSGGEGRIITFYESELTHPSHTDGLVDSKDPVIAGDVVGVAESGASATTDPIAVDTEGKWWLNVVATDADGNSAVAVGDPIYINTTTAILSKNYDKATQKLFGYALSTLTAGSTDVVKVKVHNGPGDDIEKVGTSSTPYSIGTRAIAREYRYRSTATSGDVRGIYLSLGLNGAGSSGEALRNRTIVEAVGVATAHGGHSGIEFDTDGTVTGLAVGHRATFMAPDRDAFATIAGGMSELWAEGDSTDYGAATMHSIHRFVNGGDATGAATADNVFEFSGLSATQYAANTDTPDHALRVIINGEVRYIMVSEAQS